MRSKIFLILALVLALASTAAPQTKTTGTVSCAKPDPAYAIDVGDRAGHSLFISKSVCTWTTPVEISGLQTQDGADVTYGDANGAKVRGSGYHVSTMSNGDKIYVVSRATTR